jgi:hypothetical protein
MTEYESAYDNAVYLEISDRVQEALIQKFPKLPIEIIDSAVDDAKNDFISLFGHSNRRFTVDAEDFFYFNALENIKRHQTKVQEVFKMLMLIRERERFNTPSTSNSFGSYVTNLDSRPLEMIGDILKEAFTEEN